ncbi:hypothetical protein WMF04_07755 [Sorangium sp. So ce260]|uniref:hypothetical protein n=1 Tax=Sorangium sp. So ce260 TaxID=3133291 RepID=UPI003F603806
MSELTTLVLLHSAFFSVLEKTTFSARFIPSATIGIVLIACAVGQKLAICSYVTRPNSSVFPDLSPSAAYSFSSAPWLFQLTSPFVPSSWTEAKEGFRRVATGAAPAPQAGGRARRR